MRISQFIPGQAVDHLADVLLLTGLDGSILDANAAALGCYRYSRAEMVALSVNDLKAPDDQDPLDDQVREAAAQGVRLETVHRRSDGTLFPVEMLSVPVSADGETAMLVIIFDLTERKEAEEHGRRFEEFSRKHDAVFLLMDAGTGQLLDVNDAALRFYGYSLPQMRSMKIGDVNQLPPDELDAERQRAAKAERKYFVVPHRLASGEIRTVEVHTTPVDMNGRTCLFSVIHDISDRERADEALRKSEEKYATAFHASPDSITITRLSDGEILEANEGFERLLGYTRAETVGKTTAELSAYADSGTRAGLVTGLRETGEINDFDATLRRKDGTLVEVIVSARVIEFQGEECFLAVALDVTKRRKAEELVRARGAALREAQRIGQVGSFDWEARTDAIEWSDEYYRIYGFDPEQPPPAYEEHLKAYSPESAARLDATVKRSMQTGEPYELDLEQVGSDGTRKWIAARGEVKRDADNKIIGVHGTVRDITERKMAEEALAASERFSQRMLEATPNLIYIYDLIETRNIYTNREVTEFLGYTSEEILAFGSALFEHILHPDDAALVAEHHARLHRLAPSDDCVLEVDYRMKRASGEWRWLHSRDVPFARDDSGAVTQILGSTEDITERKAASEQLRESEERHRSIVESMTDAYVRADGNGLIVDASPSAVVMYGFDSAEEMLGLPGGSLNANEQDAVDVRECLLRHRVVVDHVCEGRRKDGSTFWASLNALYHFDKQGQPVGAAAFVRDISARKQVEETVLQFAQRQSALFDGLQEGFTVFDADGVRQDVNPAFCAMTGFSRDELVGVGPPHPCWPPEESEAIGEALAAVLRGRAKELELTLMRKGGERFPALLSPSIVSDSQGRVELCFATIKDITERKRVEEALRESERHFREALEEVNLIAIILDAAGRITFCNDFLLQLTSWQRDEVMGKDWFSTFVPDSARERGRQTLSGIVESDIVPFDYENMIATRYGAERLISWSTPVLRDEQGNPIGVVGIGEDITERRHAEHELHRTKASAEEALRGLQDAVTRQQDLARTDPLTGVNNRRHWFELAEHEFEVAARYHRPLSMILCDVDGCKLINDTFGHAVGDQILEHVAQAARAELRSADVIGRYGGEEFVIMLPVTTAQEAYPIAERILAGVGAIRVETAKEQAVVTLSIGIAETLFAPPGERLGGDDSVERVVHRADDAMYAAKAAGRNRISVYSEPAERPEGGE